MALMASDLRGRGHVVQCGLVHPTRAEAAGRSLDGQVDLVVVDSIFPFPVLRRLREFLDAPFVVGGHSALQHALAGPGEYAFVGPGRPGLADAVDALARGEREGVRGLWWRGPEGLDCGPPLSGVGVREAVLPFEPVTDWGYWGPPRAPGSDLRLPSIVAEMGCVWDRSVLADGGPFRGVRARMPAREMTPRAAQRIEQEFVGRDGGCTFCVFRHGEHSGAGREAEGLLRTQVAWWLAAGARGLSLQTEHPAPWLETMWRILDEVDPQGRIEELRVRTIPWLLLRHERRFLDGIEAAARRGRRLSVVQVGFEAFDDRTLALFHKGLDAAQNREAAQRLGAWSERWPDTFFGTHGHGLILLHPWTRPEDLTDNLLAIREHAPWLAGSLEPSSRLELYHEWSPLFWKAQDDRLVTPSSEGFGWSWTYQDAGTGEIVAAWSALLHEGGGPSAELLGQILEVWGQQRDPATRRAAYQRLRQGLAPD